MTELERKAYAYAIERQKDPNYPVYNWETEITDAAYEQGYKDAAQESSDDLTLGKIIQLRRKAYSDEYIPSWKVERN